MIDGNVNDFVEGLYYGEERWFIYKTTKYFIQGWTNDGKFTLVLDQMDPDPGIGGYLWECTKKEGKRREVVEDFLGSEIFDGKTFWEIEQEIKWIDG
jgi:hypothetical protein